MGTFAAVFHFQPLALWDFDHDDIIFWAERAEEWGKQVKEATGA
jgi:hypothetical protein